MSKYAGRITNLIRGQKEELQLEGASFPATNQNVSVFKKWWRNVNIEHFLVFWLTGSVTIVLLSLLAYSTVFKAGGLSEGIGFVIQEADAIGANLVPAAGIFFLLVVSSTLFGTQLTVFDATSRIISENIILTAPRLFGSRTLPKLYYGTLWLFILVGVLISLFSKAQPLQLLVLAAVLNAFAMFVHTGLTLWTNKTLLPKKIAPNTWRTAVMTFACAFYGIFSIFVILNEIKKLFN